MEWSDSDLIPGRKTGIWPHISIYRHIINYNKSLDWIGSQLLLAGVGYHDAEKVVWRKYTWCDMMASLEAHYPDIESGYIY